MMKKTLGAALLIVGLLAGAALAQLSPGANRITSLVGSFFIDIGTASPQTAVLPLNGGTFVCTSGGTITVANTNVDGGSLIVMTLKTKVAIGSAAPFVSTITAATSFVATCATSDTSTYNYLIVG